MQTDFEYVASDARAPITAWKLLVWMYRRQMVQYETDHLPSPRDYQRLSVTALAAASWGMRGVDAREGGCINGAGTTAHEDAHIVHAVLMQVLAPKDQLLIIQCAERDCLPEWNPAIPAARVVPVRRGGTGSVRMIYGKSNRPIACMIDYEGVTEPEARMIRQRARESYKQCWLTLRWLSRRFGYPGDGLERWKITGIGIDARPWEHAV